MVVRFLRSGGVAGGFVVVRCLWSGGLGVERDSLWGQLLSGLEVRFESYFCAGWFRADWTGCVRYHLVQGLHIELNRWRKKLHRLIFSL